MNKRFNHTENRKSLSQKKKSGCGEKRRTSPKAFGSKPSHRKAPSKVTIYAGTAIIGLGLSTMASAGLFSNLVDAATNVVETVVETTVDVVETVVETTVDVVEVVVDTGTQVVDAGTGVVGSVIPREADSEGYYSEEQQALNLIDPPEANNPVDSALRNKLKLNDGTTVVHFNSNPSDWNDGFVKRWYGSYQLITLDGDTTGARCADGSNYKFLVDRSAKSSNMAIQFEAGGGCWDSHTCPRADGGFSNGGLVGRKLGGDSPDQATLRLAAQASLVSGIVDDVDDTFNPKYKDWTKVYLPYCTADLGTGDAVHDYGFTHENGSTTFENNGRKIQGAVLAWLKENLEQPKQMLLSGQSAGGFSTLLHYNLYRTALEPTQGYVFDDAGPIVPSDQNDSFEEAPTGPTMIAIRNAWNAVPYLQWMEEESVRANLSAADGFDMTNMGSINSFLAKKWSNDRFLLATSQHDSIIAGFSYNVFDDRIMNATNVNDANSLRRMKQGMEINRLKELLDTLPNFGYFMPGYRPIMGGHVLSFPIVASSAKNEDDGNTIRSAILNLMDDSQALMQSYESNVFADYNRYHDCANGVFAADSGGMATGQMFIDKDDSGSEPESVLTQMFDLAEMASCALPFSIRPDIINVAEGQLISQSSTYSGGGWASLAVDGDTNGVWSNGSVTHTVNESNPWIKVDLGWDKTLYGVTIWNRTDCCSDRLSNFRVTYLDSNNQVIDYKDYTRTAGTKTNIVSMKSGVRYVKVELLGSGILSLAELQVWGHWDDNSFSSDFEAPYQGESVVRVELDNSYLQLREVEVNINGEWHYLNSSQFNAELTARDEYAGAYGAAQAGDGSTSTPLYHSKTASGTNWWQAVVKDYAGTISGVRILTRADGYAFRIDNARIYVNGEQIGTWLWDGKYIKTF